MVRGAGVLSIFVALLATPLALAQQQPAPPQLIEVRIADTIANRDTGRNEAGPFSGRLVISAVPLPPGTTAESVLPQPGAPPQQAQMSAFMRLSSQLRDPATALLAAMEIENAKPGDVILLDADRIAYPKPFSSLPPGTYYAQATLDRDRDLSFTGYPSGGDLMSRQIVFSLPGERPSFTLERTYTQITPWPGLDNIPQGRTPNPNTVELRSHTRDLDFVSPSLSRFFGEETHIRGWVLLPPGYDENKDTYPAVYSFGGFGATLNTLSSIPLIEAHHPMYGRPLGGDATTTPPMIWVFLDHSWPTGTHEFADSANNGPWGKALTEELIPWIETQYRMDAKPSGRLLTGHSSGGWAALWLQVKYPKLFGGAWPTAPDPVDFRDFTSTDIYAPNANVFYATDGSLKPLVREGDKITSFKTYSDFESVRGPVSGQLASFEWVFSPKGPDGKPLPLFDRKTGAVDPQVAQHWRDHYDIAHYIRTNWSKLKPDLDGKIHLTVGTADTYYLDQPARLMKQTLDALGAKSEFVFLEGRNHGNLNVDNSNAVAMYRVARPGSTWQPQSIERPPPPTPRPRMPTVPPPAPPAPG